MREPPLAGRHSWPSAWRGADRRRRPGGLSASSSSGCGTAGALGRTSTGTRANDNACVREIKVRRPAGRSLDRDGRVWWENRTGLAVKVTRASSRTERPSGTEGTGAWPGAGLEHPANRQERLDQLQGAAYSAANRQSRTSSPNVVAYLLARQKGVSRRDGGARVPRRYPHRQIGGPPVRPPWARDHEGAAQDQRYRGGAWATGGASRGSSTSTDRVPAGTKKRRLARAVRRPWQPQGRAVGAPPGAGSPAAPVGGHGCAEVGQQRSGGPRARSRS